MTNPLQQTIEALAKEKGIEPEIDHHRAAGRDRGRVAQALQDNEKLQRASITETGQVDLFAVKHIVDRGHRPGHQISLEEAQELYGEEAEVDMEIEFPKRTEDARPHRRADRQAGDLPEGARGGAREHLRRVQPARSAK